MNRRQYLLALLAMLCIGAASQPAAEATPDRRRYIITTISKDRIPVPNAYVELWLNNRRIRTGYTDGNGKYTFGNLDFGTYEVRASATIRGVRYRGSLARSVTGTHYYLFPIALQR